MDAAPRNEPSDEEAGEVQGQIAADEPKPVSPQVYVVAVQLVSIHRTVGRPAIRL